MFTLSVLDILLFEGRLALSPAQRGKGRERVNLEPDDCKLATTILELRLCQLHKLIKLGKLWLEFL